MSSSNENKDAVLEDLRRLSQGLLYISETDAPLEVVRFPASSGSAPTAGEVAAWAGKDGTVETLDVVTFFRPMANTEPETTEDQETAPRFQALQAYLEQHLEEVQVYRIGRRRITALVLGRVGNGDWIGVKTELVET